MKNYTEIASEIINLVDEAVECGDELRIDTLMARAYALGWVIGATEEDIKTVYDGKLTEIYVIRRGEEGGVNGV